MLLLTFPVHGLQVSQTWVADLGNGSYKNPVLHADYSDPDVVRVGEDYYMTASSFNAVPGLPILHSKDLVNWKLVGHALKRLVPFEHFEKVQHGNGVWAPAIRYHQDTFYIYYPDPDFGIYVIKAKNATGPWSEPVLVEAGKGLIDPCPLWDGDTVYLVHAFAGSRAGIKSIIAVKELNKTGDQVVGPGRIVYDGHGIDPTVEGPKFYKRNGYYYIFAPAGGVTHGWQIVLRSKNVYGPYERRVVMDQGTTIVNGPHQGAWMDTPAGEDWFVHFQDKGVYGRVVHLQPMKWVDDWPVIGIDDDRDGKGEPVLVHRKPNVGKTYPVATPDESDEFDKPELGLQWQWRANPKATWWFMNTAKGSLRLYAQKIPDHARNLSDVPNLLLQKFPAEEFKVTTRISFHPETKIQGERAGLVVMGQHYASLSLVSNASGVDLVYSVCREAMNGNPERQTILTRWESPVIYLRMTVAKGGVCTFSYSRDGKKFTEAGEAFQAYPGKWIGAKVGLFCTRTQQTNDSGFADIDYFRVEPK